MAGTTTDKLERLMQTKADIKSALIEKGQTPGDVFSEYPDMVRAISGGGTSLFHSTISGVRYEINERAASSFVQIDFESNISGNRR